MCRTRVMAVLWLFGLSVGAVVLRTGLASSITYADRLATPVLLGQDLINRDPAQVVGPDACAECHENEHQVWMGTAHRTSAQTLTRNAEAKRIAAAIGVRRIKTDERCATCHFTIQKIEDKRPKSISGVSCESCHSAAASWVEPHSRFGHNAATADDETLLHRTARLSNCDSLGMIRPARLYELGAACYSCHSIADQELIQTAGHPNGEQFEFASWTQGDIRHNFVRAGSDENPRSAPERVRVMFLVGAALRLEYACRAVTDGAPTDAITNAVANLGAIDEVVDIDAVSQLIEIGRGVEGAAVAAEAIEHVREIGMLIAENQIGADAAQLDPLIPASRTREGQ